MAAAQARASPSSKTGLQGAKRIASVYRVMASSNLKGKQFDRLQYFRALTVLLDTLDFHLLGFFGSAPRSSCIETVTLHPSQLFKCDSISELFILAITVATLCRCGSLHPQQVTPRWNKRHESGIEN